MPNRKTELNFTRSLSRRGWLVCTVILGLLFFNSPSSQAYSVLTHEQIVDLLWKAELRPMLLARYPNATDDQIRTAHAYAYGGCLIQDIGYYPFGNHFFSDLVHYVRSGDFVSTMLAESNDINEYAFALGSLAHYASDLAGHPAVNIAVGETFPKLRAKYGGIVTYADNPTAHIRTEFGFDVVQVARDRFTSQAFHDFIGFEVSRPLLERAFQQTYGLPLTDVFPNLDLSIGSFRYSVSTLIPNMTHVALAMKKDEILQEDPSMTREKFIYHLKRSQYRRDFGTNYKGPGLGTRLLAILIKILPKIGPLKALDFKMPTTSTETLYMQSVNDSRDHYEQDLKLVQSNDLALDNRDFDTGKETRAGEYSLTDETYANLVNKLASEKFARLTPQLQTNILAFYQNPQTPAFAAKNKRKWKKTQSNLALLKSFPATASNSDTVQSATYTKVTPVPTP
ncbi:zinc dependent phospholipase C family protein [Acidicapsa ligni]|uniref:zinc dependent phospholipase C family protein n=1 Tax=Acidicapsa ligni TaxID=542300 RepID=UPI0021DF6F17|nr:zinc dependent phospholipase C family protein [Acidicapsa ligni]